MSNTTELPDLDKLEALARAATPGRWMRLFGERTVYDRMEDGCRGNAIVRADLGYGLQDISNLDFIAAANPAAVLALIALARRAKPEGEAPQAELSQVAALLYSALNDAYQASMFDGDELKRVVRAMSAYNRYRSSPAATLSPLCGAQHAESDKEAEQELRSQMAFIAAYDPNELDGGDSQEGMRAADRLACIIRRARKTLDVCDALAAQQAAAPGALDADEMTRLRRLMAALRHSDAFELTDDYVRGILCTLLGQAAGELERATLAAVPSAPGTPEAPKGGV